MEIFEALFSASQARVLLFLSRKTGRTFFEREIVEATDISRSAVNLATRALHEAGLVHRERRGRMNFYSVNDRHPFIRQFKTLDTLASLEPLLKDLRPLSRQITLFGSRADGTNTHTSDIDLFILAAEREKVMKIIGRYRTKLPIQPIVMNSQELVESKEKDAAFHMQVKRGIVVWEANDELGA
jgi:DNA-binding transcriptional ArsR family regulator